MVLAAAFLAGCQHQQADRITDAADYEAYLGQAPTTGSKYFELWNGKIRPDSMQLSSFSAVAGEYARYFARTGQIGYLKKAEQALDRGLEIAAIGKAGFYRSLARNYISQHRFSEALELAQQASRMGSGRRANDGLLFDLYMELGQPDSARVHLEALEDMGRLDYLIRLSKWRDHEGDLEGAIANLKIATRKAEASNDPGLILWCYTNLADYYGHAGRLDQSYAYYLKALEVDPTDAYAKKGIAWIVYSHERRPEEALRILEEVSTYYQSPDLWLLMEEIAGALPDPKRQYGYLDRALSLMEDPGYGEMYNTHRVLLLLDKTGQMEEAVALARREAERRPTAATMGLLAYAYYRNGYTDKALALVRRHVEGKTYEPQPLLYAAEVYRSAGMTARARHLGNEIKDAVYELGPTAEPRINALAM